MAHRSCAHGPIITDAAETASRARPRERLMRLGDAYGAWRNAGILAKAAGLLGRVAGVGAHPGIAVAAEGCQ